MTRPSLPYVGPFAVLLVLLVVARYAALPSLALQGGIVAVMLVLIAVLARRAPDFRSMRLRNWAGAVLLGVAVFAVWVLPDRLFPGYRHSSIFENLLTGSAQGTGEFQSQGKAVLWLRAFRAAAIVPLVEELFWRAWMMRWLISPEFLKVPLGAWSASAFWIVAALFAAEHGAYWDVGLAAGVLYNWWMIRTKSLGDLVLAHAVTNACLSAYIVAAGRWEYWQ